MVKTCVSTGLETRLSCTPLVLAFLGASGTGSAQHTHLDYLETYLAPLFPRSSAPLPLSQRRKQVVALMFVIGLGLTNHLTSVFLLPPAARAVGRRLLHDRQSGRRALTIRPLMRMLPAAVAFVASHCWNLAVERFFG